MRSAHLEDSSTTRSLQDHGAQCRFAGSWISPGRISTPSEEGCRGHRRALEKLERIVIPIEKVYSIADHTRCLAYMLGDCIVLKRP